MSRHLGKYNWENLATHINLKWPSTPEIIIIEIDLLHSRLPKRHCYEVTLLAFHHDHETLMDQPTAKLPISNDKCFVGQVPRSWFGRP